MFRSTYVSTSSTSSSFPYQTNHSTPAHGIGGGGGGALPYSSPNMHRHHNHRLPELSSLDGPISVREAPKWRGDNNGGRLGPQTSAGGDATSPASAGRRTGGGGDGTHDDALHTPAQPFYNPDDDSYYRYYQQQPLPPAPFAGRGEAQPYRTVGGSGDAIVRAPQDALLWATMASNREPPTFHHHNNVSATAPTATGHECLDEFLLTAAEGDGLERKTPAEVAAYVQRLRANYRYFGEQLREACERAQHYKLEVARLREQLETLRLQQQKFSMDSETQDGVQHALEEQVRRLRGQLEEQEGLLYSLRQQLHARAAQSSTETTTEVMRYEAERVRAAEEARQSQQALRDLAAELQRSKTQLKALEVQQQQQQPSDLARRLQELEKENAQLQQSLTAEREEHEAEKRKLEEALATLQADTDTMALALTQRAPISVGDYETQLQQLASLQRQLEQERTEATARKAATAPLEATALELTELRQHVAAAAHDKSALERAVHRKDEEIARLQELLQCYKAETDAAEEANRVRTEKYEAALLQQADDAAAARLEAEQALAELRRQLQQQQQQQDQQQPSGSRSTSNPSNTSNDTLGGPENEVHDLRAALGKIATLMRQVQELGEALEAQQTERAALQEQLQTSEAHQQELLRENAYLGEEIQRGAAVVLKLEARLKEQTHAEKQAEKDAGRRTSVSRKKEEGKEDLHMATEKVDILKQQVKELGEALEVQVAERAALQEVVESAQDAQQKQSATIAQYEEQLAALQEENKQLGEEVKRGAAVVLKLEGHLTDMPTIAAANKELEKANKALVERLRELEAAYTRSEADVQALSASRAQEEARAHELEQGVRAAEERASTSQKEQVALARLEEKKQQEQNALAEELTSTQATVAQYEEQLAALQEENKQLGEEVKRGAAVVLKLEGRLTDMPTIAAANKELEKVNKALVERLRELEAAYTTSTKDLKALQKSYDVLQQDEQALAAALKQMKEASGTTEVATQQTEERWSVEVANLRAALDQLAREKALLTEALATHETRAQELERSLSTSQEEQAALAKQVDKKQEKESALSEQLKDAQDAIAQYEEQLAALRKENKQLGEEVKRGAAVVLKLEGHLTDMPTIAAANKELEKANKALVERLRELEAAYTRSEADVQALSASRAQEEARAHELEQGVRAAEERASTSQKEQVALARLEEKKQQEQNALAEQLTSTQATVAQYEEQLAALQEENKQLGEEVKRGAAVVLKLEGRLTDMPTIAAANKELEKVNKALVERLHELEAAYTTSTKDLKTLQKSYDALQQDEQALAAALKQMKEASGTTEVATQQTEERWSVEVANLRAALDQLAREKALLTEALATHETRAQELERSLSTSQEEQAALAKQMDKKQEKESALSEQLKDAQDAIAQYEEQLAALRKENKQLGEEVKRGAAVVLKLEGHLTDMPTIAAANKELEKVNKALVERLRELEAAYTRSEADVQALSASRAQEEARAHELEQGVRAAEERASTSQKEQAALEKADNERKTQETQDLHIAAKQVEFLMEQVKELGEALKTKAAQQEQLVAAQGAQDEALAALQRENALLGEEIQRGAAVVLKLEARLKEQASEQAARQSDAAEALEASNKALAERVAQLEQSAKAREQAIAKLEDAVVKAQTDAEELESALEEKDDSLQALQESYDELLKDEQALIVALKKLKEETAAVQSTTQKTEALQQSEVRKLEERHQNEVATLRAALDALVAERTELADALAAQLEQGAQAESPRASTSAKEQARAAQEATDLHMAAETIAVLRGQVKELGEALKTKAAQQEQLVAAQGAQDEALAALQRENALLGEEIQRGAAVVLKLEARLKEQASEQAARQSDAAEALEASNKALAERVAQLEQSAKAREQAIAKLEDAVVKAQTDAEELESALEEKDDSLQALQESYDELLKDEQALIVALKKLKEETAAVQSTTQKTEALQQSEVRKLEERHQNEVATLRAALDALAAERMQLAEVLSDKEKALAAADEEVNASRVAAKAREEKIATLEDTIVKAQTGAGELEAVLKEKDDSLQALQESYDELLKDEQALIVALKKLKETTASLEVTTREAESQQEEKMKAVEARAAALEARLRDEATSVAAMQALLETKAQEAAASEMQLAAAGRALAEKEARLQELTTTMRTAAEENLAKLQEMEQLHKVSLAQEVALKEEAFVTLTKVKNAMQYAKMDADKALSQVQGQLRALEEAHLQLQVTAAEQEQRRQREKANAAEALRRLAEKYAEGKDEIDVLTAQRKELLATEKEAERLRLKAAELESSLRADKERLEEQEGLIEELEAALRTSADQQEGLVQQVQELADRATALTAEKERLEMETEALKKTLEDTARSYNDRIVVEERLRDRSEKYRQLAAARQLELRKAAAVWLQATESLRDGLLEVEGAADKLKGRASGPLKLQPLQEAVAWYARVALRESPGSEAPRDSYDLSEDDSSRRGSTEGSQPPPPDRVRELFEANASRLCTEVSDQLRRLREAGRAAARREEALERKLALEQQLRSALDALAVENVDLKEAARNYQNIFFETQTTVQQITNDFQQQMQEEKEAASLEVITARRDMERAEEARRRAQQRLQLVQEELSQLQDAHREMEGQLQVVEEEREELRARLTAASEAVYAEATVEGSVSHSGDVSVRPSRYAAAVAQEQAQMLQVTSLQSDLLLARRQLREMEAQEGALRRSVAVSDREAAVLRTETARLQKELAQEREHTAVLKRYSQLLDHKEMDATLEELRELRLKVRELEGVVFRFEEKERELARVRSQQEVQAGRRREAVLTRLRSMSSRMTDVRRQLAAEDARASTGDRRGSTSGGLTFAADPQLVAEMEHLQQDLENYEKLAVEHHLQLESLQDQLVQEREARTTADKAVQQLTRSNEQLRLTLTQERQSGPLGLSPFTPAPFLQSLGAPSPLPRMPPPATPTPEEEEEDDDEKETTRTPLRSVHTQEGGEEGEEEVVPPHTNSRARSAVTKKTGASAKTEKAKQTKLEEERQQRASARGGATGSRKRTRTGSASLS